MGSGFDDVLAVVVVVVLTFTLWATVGRLPGNDAFITEWREPVDLPLDSPIVAS